MDETERLRTENEELRRELGNKGSRRRVTYELVAYNTDQRYGEARDTRWREYTTSAKRAAAFAKIPKIQFTDSGHGIVFNAREHKGGKRKPLSRQLSEYVGLYLSIIDNLRGGLADKVIAAMKAVEHMEGDPRDAVYKLRERIRELKKENEALAKEVADASRRRLESAV